MPLDDVPKLHREPDPDDELFDVLTSAGEPTGTTRPRRVVHQDGDWHRAFHCFVVYDLWSDDPHLLFQRRSSRKDTWPGRLDVAVGGHYRAGETWSDVVREIEEELGLMVPDQNIIPLGIRRVEGCGPGWIDREFQDVHGLHVEEAFPGSLRPSAEEISEVHLISRTSLDDLFAGACQVVTSRCTVVGQDGLLRASDLSTVTVDDFVPVSDDYWRVGTRAAVDVLRGIAPQGSYFRGSD